MASFPLLSRETQKILFEILSNFQSLLQPLGAIGEPVFPAKEQVDSIWKTITVLKSHDTYYAQLDYRVMKLVKVLGISDALGYDEKGCKIEDMIAIVHPNYVLAYLYFGAAAYSELARLWREEASFWKRSLQSRYIINYPVRNANGKYVWIKQMTMPFTYDSTGKAVEQLSSYIIVSRFEGASLPVAPRIFGEDGKRRVDFEKKICHDFLRVVGLNLSPWQQKIIITIIDLDDRILSSEERLETISTSKQRMPVEYSEIKEKLGGSKGRFVRQGSILHEKMMKAFGHPFDNIYEIAMFLKTMYIKDFKL